MPRLRLITTRWFFLLIFFSQSSVALPPRALTQTQVEERLLTALSQYPPLRDAIPDLLDAADVIHSQRGFFLSGPLVVHLIFDAFDSQATPRSGLDPANFGSIPTLFRFAGSRRDFDQIFRSGREAELNTLLNRHARLADTSTLDRGLDVDVAIGRRGIPPFALLIERNPDRPGGCSIRWGAGWTRYFSARHVDAGLIEASIRRIETGIASPGDLRESLNREIMITLIYARSLGMQIASPRTRILHQLITTSQLRASNQVHGTPNILTLYFSRIIRNVPQPAALYRVLSSFYLTRATMRVEGSSRLVTRTLPAPLRQAARLPSHMVDQGALIRRDSALVQQNGMDNPLIPYIGHRLADIPAELAEQLGFSSRFVMFHRTSSPSSHMNIRNGAAFVSLGDASLLGGSAVWGPGLYVSASPGLGHYGNHTLAVEISPDAVIGRDVDLFFGARDGLIAVVKSQGAIVRYSEEIDPAIVMKRLFIAHRIGGAEDVITALELIRDLDAAAVQFPFFFMPFARILSLPVVIYLAHRGLQSGDSQDLNPAVFADNLVRRIELALQRPEMMLEQEHAGLARIDLSQSRLPQRVLTAIYALRQEWASMAGEIALPANPFRERWDHVAHNVTSAIKSLQNLLKYNPPALVLNARRELVTSRLIALREIIQSRPRISYGVSLLSRMDIAISEVRDLVSVISIANEIQAGLDSAAERLEAETAGVQSETERSRNREIITGFRTFSDLISEVVSEYFTHLNRHVLEDLADDRSGNRRSVLNRIRISYAVRRHREQYRASARLLSSLMEGTNSLFSDSAPVRFSRAGSGSTGAQGFRVLHELQRALALQFLEESAVLPSGDDAIQDIVRPLRIRGMIHRMTAAAQRTNRSTGDSTDLGELPAQLERLVADLPLEDGAEAVRDAAKSLHFAGIRNLPSDSPFHLEFSHRQAFSARACDAALYRTLPRDGR